MGAHPKQRTSHARKNRRRANDFLTPPTLVADPDAPGMVKLAHHVGPTGMYKGRQVIPDPTKKKNSAS